MYVLQYASSKACSPKYMFVVKLHSTFKMCLLFRGSAAARGGGATVPVSSPLAHWCRVKPSWTTWASATPSATNHTVVKEW